DKPERATFISRPNRFTSIVKDKDVEKMVYLPDPGRLEELLIPGASVITEKRRQKGKTHYDLLLVETQSFPDKKTLMVSVDSRLPNKLFKWLITEKLIDYFGNIKMIKSEPKVDHGRLDYYIESSTGKHFIELKSVNLIDASGTARFPDAPTKRGTKHLKELMNLKKQGYTCWIFFLIVRKDALSFSPFFERDPLFSETLQKARKAGVKIKAIKFGIDQNIHYLGEVPTNIINNPFAGYWPEF
ncbi:MAG: DNA/RNA nuclease SfsA, partial [Petrotogales bacterium]